MDNFNIVPKNITSLPTWRFTINAEDLLYFNPTLNLSLIKTVTFTCMYTDASGPLSTYSNKTMDVYVSINDVHYILDYYFSAPLENMFNLHDFAVQEVTKFLGHSLLEQILYKLLDRNIEKQKRSCM